jgi:hypothetical protein
MKKVSKSDYRRRLHEFRPGGSSAFGRLVGASVILIILIGAVLAIIVWHRMSSDLAASGATAPRKAFRSIDRSSQR